VSLPNIIPAGKHIVADAGYAISSQVIIPYPVKEVMSPEEAWYIYLHSRTRITVKRAIDMVKNRFRFRIFKVPLNQKEDYDNDRSETEGIGRIMVACFVPHTILINLRDATNIAEDENIRRGGVNLEDYQDLLNGNVNQKRDQIRQYLFENKSIIKSKYG
jgi:hypothetical protein